MGGLVEALIAGVARRHGLTHAALNALAVIEGEGAPLPAGEISSRMHITSGTMTSVLDTLERNGHIERFADPGDRRRVLVDITPAAQVVLDQMLPEVQQVCHHAASAIGDDRLQALLDTLGELRAGVEAVPDDLPPPPARRTPKRLRRSP